MKITIHQPDFLPWLGFFDRWRQSDLYVVLDDVQFIRRGWHHRDKIKTAAGPVWLTVPVRKKGRFEQAIRETEIDWSEDWPQAHFGALKAAYARAPAFARVMDHLADIYGRRHRLLMDLNLDLLRYAAAELGIQTPLRLASEAGVTATRSERLVALTRHFGGEVYLTGTGSRDYLQEEIFARDGLAVEWQEYRQTPYPQLHGPFLAGLSVLDYLMMREPLCP